LLRLHLFGFYVLSKTFIAIVVQDATSYQQLLNTIEELETIIGIKKGLDDLAQGHTRPLNQFVEEMQKKHGISS
jgi:hypothetical protein